MMTTRRAHVAGGKLCQRRAPLRQRMRGLVAAFLALGVVLVVISSTCPPVPEDVHFVSGKHYPAERFQSSSRTPIRPARFTAVGAPAAAPLAPTDNNWHQWELRTTDDNPGGTMKWSPSNGAVEVTDSDIDDGYFAQAEAIVGYTTQYWDDEPPAHRKLLVEANGEPGADGLSNANNSQVRVITDWDRAETYRFRICLVKVEERGKLEFCRYVVTDLWLKVEDDADEDGDFDIGWNPNSTLETTDGNGGDDGEVKDTLDGNGGRMNWNRNDGVVSLCDGAADGWHAQAEISTEEGNFSESATVYNMNTDNHRDCEYGVIPDYSRLREREIYFRVCIVEGDEELEEPRKYCNEISSSEWFGIVAPPPSAPSVPITERPDDFLPKDHAAPPEAVAKPLKIGMGFLVWFVFWVFVASIVFAGGNMALKHRKGEAGAHGTGLGWIMAACVVGTLAVATSIVSLLLSPFQF